MVVTDLRDQDGNKSSGNGDQDYNIMGLDGKNRLDGGQLMSDGRQLGSRFLWMVE